jgi:hypothetical protein
MMRIIGSLIAVLCFLTGLIILIVFGHGTQEALGLLIFGALFIFSAVLAWRSFQQNKRK